MLLTEYGDEVTNTIAPIANQKISNTYFASAYRAFEQGDLGQARAGFRQAMKCKKLFVKSFGYWMLCYLPKQLLTSLKTFKQKLALPRLKSNRWRRPD